MSCNILVVDDSVTIQKVIKIAFSKYDVDIRTASSLIEAKSEISKFKPHVMIIDANLSGTTSANDFQKLATQASSPIILLVGSYESFDDKSFREAGFRYFLKKPFEAQDLINMVKEASSVGLDLKDKGAQQAAPSEKENNANMFTSPLPPPPPPPPIFNVPINENIPLPDDNIENLRHMDEMNLPPPPPPPNLAAEIPIYTDKSINMNNTQHDDVVVPPPLSVVPPPPPPPPVANVLASSLEEPYSSYQSVQEGAGVSQDAIKINTSQKGKKAFDENLSSTNIDLPLPPPPPPASFRQEPNVIAKNTASDSVSKKSQQSNFVVSDVDVHPPQASEISNIDIYNSAIMDELEKIVKRELEALVKKAVFAYCEENFSTLAKEVISAQINRLLEEKTRLLIDV